LPRRLRSAHAPPSALTLSRGCFSFGAGSR
jgi:hypothetical protein